MSSPCLTLILSLAFHFWNAKHRYETQHHRYLYTRVGLRYSIGPGKNIRMSNSRAFFGQAPMKSENEHSSSTFLRVACTIYNTYKISLRVVCHLTEFALTVSVCTYLMGKQPNISREHLRSKY